MVRPFIFPIDAVAIKNAGQPTLPTGTVIFNQLIADTKSMITDGLVQDSLKDTIESKLTELSANRFVEVGSTLPDAQRQAIADDAEALAEAMADNLSFVIVATVFNILGSTATDGNPILSFAMTPLDPVSQVPIPLVAGNGKVPMPV